MKALIILILILIAPHVAPADDDFCEQLTKLAGVVMESRQVGVTILELKEILEEDPIAMDLAVLAYQYPRYRSEEFQQEAIDEFRNEVYLVCIKHRTK